MASKPARRGRREPAYYYKSAAATVDGAVRFGESCVVQRHARISVPAGHLLDVGPFTLFDDFAELRITSDVVVPSVSTTSSSSPNNTNNNSASAGANKVTLFMGSHNHFQSYAKLHLHISVSTTSTCGAVAAPALAKVELLGSGNVFQCFAAMQVRVPVYPALSSTARRGVEVGSTQPRNETIHFTSRGTRERIATHEPCWQLGSFNIFTTHSTTVLPSSCTEEDSSRGVDEGGTVNAKAASGAGVFSPVPVMPLLEEEQQHQQQCHFGVTESQTTAAMEGAGRSVEPSMQGRTSVEERLFQDNSEDDEDTEESTHHQSSSNKTDKTDKKPASALLVSSTPAHGGAVSEKTDYQRGGVTGGGTSAPSDLFWDHARRLNSRVFLSVSGPLGIPRYGTRSVSELPIIIKRITEEEKLKRDTQQQQQQAEGGHTPTPPQEPASPVAAAAAALSSLAGYADGVHADLRAHTEEKVRGDVERVCRYYVRQYIEEADLYPVDAQYDSF